MPNKKHHIKLTPEERKELGAVARKRNAAAVKVQRAKVILAVDIGSGGPGLTDSEASLGSGLTTRSIQRLRARTCEVGPIGALERKPRETPPVPAKVTGEVEASMVKIACSDAPEGRESWTMNLIAGRLVELGLVESISGETVRVTLKKTNSSPGRKNAGALRLKKTRPS
jgi:hypothetical protein